MRIDIKAFSKKGQGITILSLASCGLRQFLVVLTHGKRFHPLRSGRPNDHGQIQGQAPAGGRFIQPRGFLFFRRPRRPEREQEHERRPPHLPYSRGVSDGEPENPRPDRHLHGATSTGAEPVGRLRYVGRQAPLLFLRETLSETHQGHLWLQATEVGRKKDSQLHKTESENQRT